MNIVKKSRQGTRGNPRELHYFWLGLLILAMSCGLQGTSEVVREPKIVDLPERITKIKAGASHTCAIGQSGTLYCWGIIARLLPELKKDAEGRPLPVGIFRPEAPIVEISSLGVYACVLLENSSVYCWGMNTVGQCGGGDQGLPLGTSWLEREH